MVELDCDRCLVKFEFSLDVCFRLVLELAGDESSSEDHGEYACGTSEMDTVFLDEPVVDLDYILHQQVFLAVPLKKVCRDDCRGLCGECGVNLNSEQCGCGDEINDSPFGVLGKLKG